MQEGGLVRRERAIERCDREFLLYSCLENIVNALKDGV